MALITLLTDFGSRDHYVACMKGVILRIAPSATLVDVSHEVGRHNVMQGAFVLRETVPWYSAGTIHLAVVDPGVGTKRRILAARYADQIVIAPDNGLLSLVHQSLPVREVRVVENPRLALQRVSGTFQGRDVMAPAAAHLANGIAFGELGPPTDHLEVLQLPSTSARPGGGVTGQVIYVDTFGNLITNISRDQITDAARLKRDLHVHLAGQDVGPIRHTYAEVGVAEPLALLGSSGMLEISVNRASASEHFGASAGAAVEVK